MSKLSAESCPQKFDVLKTSTLAFEATICFNPLRPNRDLSQTFHCNIKGLSVSGVGLQHKHDWVMGWHVEFC